LAVDEVMAARQVEENPRTSTKGNGLLNQCAEQKNH